jgi:hypothetical protein
LIQVKKMTILESNCSKRDCLYYQGVIRSDEMSALVHIHVCFAFPFGIPDDIAFGDNLHEEPVKNQGNSVVYVRR